LKKPRVSVNVTDVAKRAAVSPGTVSRVLNNNPNVEINLRLRVMEAVNQLGYVYRQRKTTQSVEVAESTEEASLEATDRNNNSKPSRAKPSIREVTFCFRAGISPQYTPDVGNTYFPLVLQGAEMECRASGLHLRYRIIEDSADELLVARAALLASKAEALLLVNFVDRTLVNGLLELNLPAVLVDHYFPDLPLDAVSSDSFYGGLQVVQHLIVRGHRRIAFVNGLPHYTVIRRFDGYREALAQAGIAYNPAYLLPGDLDLEAGIRAADQFVEQHLDCTAVFCANDNMALGFIQGLAKHNLRVPDDISVVGFDDVDVAKLVAPPLTTVQANASMLGHIAIRKLLDRVAAPTLSYTQTLVRVALVERESVRSILPTND
jgi:LacI family transcriptional regulator